MFRFSLWGRHGLALPFKLNDNAKGSAPLKLPATQCPDTILSYRLETAKIKGSISLVTPRYPKARFKVSFLCYALIQQPQYEATVKLLGSFRLTAGTRHLYRDCIFTEQVLETVSHSLHHSCTSELTRQGNTLYKSFFLNYRSRTLCFALEQNCTHIGLYLHHQPDKSVAAVPNVGLL